MKIINIIEAEQEALRFLKRIKEAKASQSFNKIERTYTSKETGALKRASMDLTRSLAKMRNNIWE